MKSERPTKTEDGQINLGRRMWRTGWGQVFGEWDEQQDIGLCMEDPSRQKHPETDQQNTEMHMPR